MRAITGDLAAGTLGCGAVQGDECCAALATGIDAACRASNKRGQLSQSRLHGVKWVWAHSAHLRTRQKGGKIAAVNCSCADAIMQLKVCKCQASILDVSCIL